MLKRMLIMLAIVGVFVAVLGGYKYFQIREAMAGGGYTPPPEAVTTIVAKPAMWDVSVRAIGNVEAARGVTLSADLPGVVSAIAFDSGQRVSRGDLLVRLDASQESAQLQGALADLELAKVDMQRKKGLVESAVIPQAMYDESVARLRQAEARVGELRATIGRKTIRAPFSGTLGIRRVNLGQYVSPGTPLVELQSTRPVLVNFTVPQQQGGIIRPGAEVRASAEGINEALTGRVAAVDSVIDQATRSLEVQAQFDNESGVLRPGMYVEVEVAAGMTTPVIPVPASAISYAPFGDSLFIVEDVEGPDGTSYTGVRQQFVKLAGSRGDMVGVVEGLKEGEEVVTSGTFKLRPGAAVKVNNTVQPSAEVMPATEDN